MLEPHILAQAAGGDLDEESREDALEPLRTANFDRLLRRPELGDVGGKRLLDVGCAHGWFLDRAAADGMTGVGIEPDEVVADRTRARGLDVRPGFFPDAVGVDERFDLIAFNDVLEHIGDVRATLRACAEHLAPGGQVLVNAPSRRGFLYKVAGLLARIGWVGPFERLWQVGFPSPHVHYLDSASLSAIARHEGLEVAWSMRLPSMTVSGLYARIRYSGDVGVPKAVVITAVMAVVAPFLRLLPSDIEVWSLTRTGD